MSRISKLMLFLALVVFVLACNFANRSVSDTQNVVETVQSLASAIPVETLQAFPSVMPDIEMPTGMPDFGNMTDPQDEPLPEWNGIPVMPAATAGSEAGGFYSYKADATVAEVTDYYKTEMEKLGWTESLSMPNAGDSALLTYDKDGHIAMITITRTEEGVSLVFLTYQ